MPRRAGPDQFAPLYAASGRRLVSLRLRPRLMTSPSKTLDTFPNPKPERDYEIHFDCT